MIETFMSPYAGRPFRVGFFGVVLIAIILSFLRDYIENDHACTTCLYCIFNNNNPEGMTVL
jgi:hypothetical protein